MKNKLILIALLLFSLISNAQSANTYIGSTNNTVEALGGLSADSAFQLPIVPMSTRFTKGMKGYGQLLVNPVDSTVHMLKGNITPKIFSEQDTNKAGGPTTPAYVIPTTQKGQRGGVATLDTSGKIPASQIGLVPINNIFVASSNAAMLALSAVVGDVCVRSDSTLTFGLQTAGPSVYTHWVKFVFQNGVTSFASRTGTVIGRKGDYITDSVAEGTSLYFTAARTQTQVAADTGSSGYLANKNDIKPITTAAGSKLLGRYNSTIGIVESIGIGTGLSLDTTGHNLVATGSGGTVTNVSSADGNATIASPTTTPVITIVSAPKLQTSRTINYTSFDGSANILLNQAINNISANYTLVLTDNQSLIYVSGSSGSLITIPTNAVVAFPIGTHIDVVNGSLGSVSFTGSGGVTIDSQGGHVTIAAKFVGVTLIKIATNEWLLIGNLI